MSCNELGVGGVDGVGGMSMRTQAALGNIHSRRWWTGCPSASCTSRVTRTRAASTAVSGSWARQRGGPDELLAVADLDAAFEVSFELLPVMGGPEPRAALQHQRRFECRPVALPEPDRYSFQALTAPGLRRRARLRAPCAPAQSRRDRPANGSGRRGSTPCRRRLSAPGASWHGAIVETRTDTGPVRAGDVSEGAFRDPSLTRGVTLAQKRMICACPSRPTTTNWPRAKSAFGTHIHSAGERDRTHPP